jgi:hypothetical protein
VIWDSGVLLVAKGSLEFVVNWNNLVPHDYPQMDWSQHLSNGIQHNEDRIGKIAIVDHQLLLQPRACLMIPSRDLKQATLQVLLSIASHFPCAKHC